MSRLRWTWQGWSCESHSHACLMGIHTVKILVSQPSEKKENRLIYDNIIGYLCLQIQRIILVIIFSTEYYNLDACIVGKLTDQQIHTGS
jgi:hypothetical protein